MTAWPPTYWFPVTKLHPPHISGDTLARPRLLDRLYQAVTAKRLTLLSAQAGSGKTTALAALREAHPELPLAWLTLDAEDDDPANFFTLMLAALQQLYPECGHSTQSLLTGLSDPGVEIKRLMGVLINDILACELAPFVFILDDFHLISEPVIHEALDYLLDRLPPSMHLVIMTRHDPPLALSRLRVREQLAEFRADELCFTGEELRDLFNDLLQFNLTKEELALLQQRTEGWVAGVRLLSLSLGQTDSAVERSQRISHLSQSHRFIFDYLVDEVFHHLTPDTRTFLLETSILSELMPAVCQAVTGRSEAAAILDDLYRRNMFLVMNERTEDREDASSLAWPAYRYHALFAQFLRRQLSQQGPDRIKTLHRLAAESYTLPARQIHHYLAAEMWPEAATIIQKVGRQQLQQGFIHRQLAHWIEALPEDICIERPWFQLILGAIGVQRGRFDTAPLYLEQALIGFKSAGDERGEILALLHRQAQQGGLADVERVEEIKRRLQASPDLLTPLHRVYFHLGVAWPYVYRYRWDQVEENLLQALEITLSSRELGAFQILAQSTGPQFLFIDQGMAPIENYARETLARFGEGDGLVQMGAYAQLAPILLYQGRLEEARRAALRVQQISERLGGFGWIYMMIDHVLVADMLARGQYAALDQYLLMRWSQLEQVDTFKIAMAPYLYIQGRSLCLQGKLDQARSARDRMGSHLVLKEHRVSYAMLNGLVAMGEGGYEAAEAYYREAVTLQEETRHTVVSNLARLGLARCYLAWKRIPEALAALKAALAEVKRRGMPGIALQEGPGVLPLLRLAVEHRVEDAFARQLVALFEELQVAGSLAAEPSPATGAGTLSPRETEVLALMAEGLTNREVAERLVIAPSTVKRHTINIYNKLAVSNRTQAVTMARELGLV